jgi:IS605 OrfB family transposase
MFLTYKFRIKDATTARHLDKMAKAVSFVWNYCNATSLKAWKDNRDWLSNFDLNYLTAGTSKDLRLQARTINIICQEHAQNRNQIKKAKLKWRTDKSLGWIPFSSNAIKIKENYVTYLKQKFRFWDSRKIEGTLKCGSFNQDARGRWYVNFVCEVEDLPNKGTEVLGIDLGLKTQITISNGIKHERSNLTKDFEDSLAMAQRAGKKKKARNIHAKIKNKRKDWAHKVTTEIANSSKELYVGDVSSSKLTRTKMAKSVNDSGWYQIKTLLQYKAIRLGAIYTEVDERYSTRTCSSCGFATGPQGLSGLGVRQWTCSNCNALHDRDVNAAKNILIAGMGQHTPIKGIS